MAKFKSNNIELRDGQKVILDTAKSQWITADGSEATINTALIGVAPTEDDHLARKDYIDSAVTTHAGSADHDGRYYTETEINAMDIHTQNTDTALGSGATAADHGTAATDQVVNVSYGTGAAPTASTTTEGSLYIKYTA